MDEVSERVGESTYCRHAKALKCFQSREKAEVGKTQRRTLLMNEQKVDEK